MTTYTMKPLASGTRLRYEHNVFAGVITSYGMSHTVSGTDLWEAPADGSEVKKGDKWLKVTHVNDSPVPVSGWMAYIHKGEPICGSFTSDGVTPPPPPPDPVVLNTNYDVTVSEWKKLVIVNLFDAEGKPLSPMGWTVRIE